jgi:DNA-binding winged helix-turn-helix (wHTH) protein
LKFVEGLLGWNPTMPNISKPDKGLSGVPHDGGAVQFGEFCLEPATRTLTREDAPVHLGARALDILIALIERAGQVVSKAELFAIVWPDTFIEESNLRVQIAALRHALGDGRSGARFVVSVPGRGYTFVADTARTRSDQGAAGRLDLDPAARPPVRMAGRDAIASEMAEEFARSWIAAWNDHDLDRVLSHYATDVVFLSPTAQRRLGNGRLEGRADLGACWRAGLDAKPNFKLDLIDVLIGHQCLTILFRNHMGMVVAQTFEFRTDGKVSRSYACHSERSLVDRATGATNQ